MKIAFDQLHIAKHLGNAVNAVRKDEHRELLSQGDATLAKTKFVWLQKPNRMKRAADGAVAIDLFNATHPARVGVERDGVEVVALHQRSLGASRVERVDRLGDELQTCANDPRGGDGAKTFRRNHQRDRVKINKCAGRIDEREDPEDQGAGLRLPQSQKLPRCDYVPPKRT